MDKKEVEEVLSEFEQFITIELEKQNSKFDKLKERLKKIEQTLTRLILTRKNLTPNEVNEIRGSKEPVSSLAVKFNRTRQQIYNIRNESK